MIIHIKILILKILNILNNKIYKLKYIYFFLPEVEYHCTQMRGTDIYFSNIKSCQHIHRYGPGSERDLSPF